MSETKNEIIELAKSEGLELTEEVAVKAVRFAFSLVRTYTPKFSFGLDGVAKYLCDFLEPKILALVDKIDGQDNPAY